MTCRSSARSLTLTTILIGLMTTLLVWPASADVSVADLQTEVRALGMGGAFVGLADDEAATRFNPAGLGFLNSGAINAHYNSQFGASNVATVLGALPHFGGGLRFFNLGGIEGRDGNDDATSAFSYTDVALTAANGWALSDLGLGMDSLAIGSRLKVDVASTRDGGGIGGGLDLGFLWRSQRPSFLPIAEMRAGLGFENVPGTGPFAVKTGLAVRPISALTIAADFGVPIEFHVGAEYRVTGLPSPLSRLDLRLGTFAQDGALSFTLGFGVGVSSIRFDYAFASHDVLPGSHRLALAWTF